MSIVNSKRQQSRHQTLQTDKNDSAMTKKIILLFTVVLIINSSFSQNIFKAILKDSSTQEPLFGVTAVLKGTNKGANSNVNGEITINNIPDGQQTIVYSSISYKKSEQTYTFPLSASSPLTILLSQDVEELDEIIIEATRGNRTIDNIPTRV
jgi:outer membrane receptor for ferrienterochelin and colicins